MLQKIFVILFILIVRRVVVITVALEKWDYYVHQYSKIVKENLNPILNEIQQTRIYMKSMKR